MINPISNIWHNIKYYAAQTGLLLAIGSIILVLTAIALIFLTWIAITLVLGWQLLLFLL